MNSRIPSVLGSQRGLGLPPEPARRAPLRYTPVPAPWFDYRPVVAVSADAHVFELPAGPEDA